MYNKSNLLGEKLNFQNIITKEIKKKILKKKIIKKNPFWIYFNKKIIIPTSLLEAILDPVLSQRKKVEV